jgi:anti-sigma B factor antagonist
MPMEDVRIERQDGIVVASLTGEVDMSNATSVRQRISEFVEPADDAVIVDVSELAFMDSAGLHSLIELGTILAERRQHLLLCVPRTSQIARAIEIVGLPHAVSVHADLDDAVEAARASVAGSRPVDPPENA